MNLPKPSYRATIAYGRRHDLGSGLFIVLLLLVVAECVQGQSENIIDLSLEQLQTVQVYSASSYLQRDREAPSAVTVITASQIRQFGYRTLADALRSVRGFDVTYDRNYDSVGVRGFPRTGGYNDHILLLINGHRLNDNVYNSAQIGTEFPLDVDLIERIEIVRGPSSSLYGTNAFLAVINVITRSPKSIGVELSGEGGGFGYYRGRFSSGGTYHGIDGLFSGTIYNSSGAARLFFPEFNSPGTNNGIVKNVDGDTSKSFYGTLHYRDFTLEAYASTREKEIPTASFGQVFNDPRSHTDDSSGHLVLTYDHSILHDAEFIASVYYDRAIYRGVYVYSPVADSETDVLNEDGSRGDCFGTSARVIKTLWQHHKITIGADFRDDLRQDQTNYNVNPLEPVLNDLRSSQEWATYLQDEYTIKQGLILNAGVRHDQYQVFGGTTNPRLALIFNPRKQTTLKLIYGQAFRTPNSYVLYYGDHISQESNPGLDPETIRTEELVWEQSITEALRISASGFANQFSDLIDQQTDPSTGLLVFTNSEKVHTVGFETELSGKARWDVEGRLSYTLQNTYDQSSGLRLPDSPGQLAKASVIVPLARRRLTFGFELQSTASRKTLAGAAVSSYAIANATITSREFGRGFRLSGSVYNLFDNHYSDPVGREIVGSSVRQNGRDFRIQLTHISHFW
jgi:Outer membrane receptor for ferrienterochelin and colicins